MPATYSYFPFDNQPSYETDWRTMASTWQSTGVVVQGSALDPTTGDLAVSPGTGLQVRVAVGRAWIQGHMFVHADDYEYLAIQPNTSGSTRNDLVVIRADFVNNVISHQVLTGTTTPVQNSTTWDLPLAILAVADGASSFTSANITDRRVSANSATVTPSVQLTNSSNIAVGASSTVTLTWNTERFDNFALHSTASNTDRITIQEAGIYYVQAMVYWRRTGGSGISGQMEMSIYHDRNSTVRQFVRDSRYVSLSNGVQSASQVIDLAAGDFLYVQASNTTAHTDVVVDAAQPYSPYFSVVKLGTVGGMW